MNLVLILQPQVGGIENKKADLKHSSNISSEKNSKQLQGHENFAVEILI